jgi:hypothetical protein
VRQRGWDNRAMINAAVLARAEEIRRSFREAQPFPHAMIENFLEPGVAEALLRDFPAFDPKRAVNELGEPGGKAVHEKVTQISPDYRAFYDYINSRPFLDAVSRLTGIDALIGDTTLYGGGTHENLDGQGLNPHVDFNIDQRMLHRRLNLLVYLNHEWEEAWGGSIELHSNPWDAQSDQVKRFLPTFNRAVIFETSERSWHGFPAIRLPPDRKHVSRKSFSIYLYTKDRPAEESVAPHGTFYVPDAPPALVAGQPLSQAEVDAVQHALLERDGLIKLYQKLLVEKEARVHHLFSAPTWRMLIGAARLKRFLFSRKRKG